jgi:predicted nucleic acid-binding protein
VSRLLAVNSSPLILLGRISQLELLPAVAAKVVVPRSVLEELKSKEADDRLAHAVSAHPRLEVVDDPVLSADVRKWNLGAGESSVVSFCLVTPGFRAVLDDLRGRRCAQALGVPLFGTLGVIIEARRQGLIPLARPVVAAIRDAGYYIQDELLDEALARVGESWRA